MILPTELRKIAFDSELVMMGKQPISPEWENRIRIIPYKVMGRDHQLIIALKPEQIQIIHNEETLTIEKGLVSFTMQQLSSDDAFQCIVHPKMLNETKLMKKNAVSTTESLKTSGDEVVF